jgi:hypothetical protein
MWESMCGMGRVHVGWEGMWQGTWDGKSACHKSARQREEGEREMEKTQEGSKKTAVRRRLQSLGFSLGFRIRFRIQRLWFREAPTGQRVSLALRALQELAVQLVVCQLAFRAAASSSAAACVLYRILVRLDRETLSNRVRNRCACVLFPESTTKRWHGARAFTGA